MNEDEIKRIIIKQVETAVVELLEKKHLYQKVQVDTSELDQRIANAKGLPPPPELLGSHRTPGSRSMTQADSDHKVRASLRERADGMLKSYWLFATELRGASTDNRQREEAQPDPQVFTLPQTVNIRCRTCKKVMPHNPGYRGMAHSIATENLTVKRGSPVLDPKKSGMKEWVSRLSDLVTPRIQMFLIPYQCQCCKGEPLLFLIRREGLKLSLVGRSHFEEVEVPKAIPESVSEFYSDAVIAFNAGRTLAALFYLRTLVEQHMRSAVSATGKITGDELADLYAKTLPQDFKGRFPSLGEVFNELSEAIHAARKDEELFAKALANTGRHFAAKQLFEIGEPTPAAQSGKKQS